MDLLGWDSLLPEQVPALREAQAAGKVRLYFIPTAIYEHLDFALSLK